MLSSETNDMKKKTFTADDAFAVYRLPFATKHVLVSAKKACNAPLNAVPNGSFVTSSFEEGIDNTAYIPAENVVPGGSFSFEVSELCTLEATGKSFYLDQASNLVSRLRAGELEKVVLSRIKLIPTQGEDLFQLFKMLDAVYPDALVYLYHIPGRGCWCGATPEKLISLTEGSLETMALAGTQRDNGLPLKTVEWTEKEVHEQRIIEEFIETALGSMDLPYSKEGPFTVKAGEMLHIRTDFMIKDTDRIDGVVEALHPGPAICGRPKGKAFDTILDTELHQRDDYCGFVGPIGLERATALFISLRCMRVFADQYALYLGGGLTARSLPELEWEETELKATTLTRVMDKVLA